MTIARPDSARYPICEAPVPNPASQREAQRPPGAPGGRHTWPFCSRRCKLVDLSKWLGEEYAIASPALGDGADAWERTHSQEDLH